MYIQTWAEQTVWSRTTTLSTEILKEGHLSLRNPQQEHIEELNSCHVHLTAELLLGCRRFGWRLLCPAAACQASHLGPESVLWHALGGRRFVNVLHESGKKSGVSIWFNRVISSWLGGQARWRTSPGAEIRFRFMDPSVEVAITTCKRFTMSNAGVINGMESAHLCVGDVGADTAWLCQGQRRTRWNYYAKGAFVVRN